MNLLTIIKWSHLPLLSLIALGLQSCSVSNARPHASIGVGAVRGNGLIRTTNARWMYDPFRRHYYDLNRRAYFNHLNGRYLQRVPQRFSNRVYPNNWSNRRGVCPAPRLQTRNRNYNNYNNYNNRQNLRNRGNQQGRVSRQLQREGRMRRQNISANTQRSRPYQQYRNMTNQGRRNREW